MQDDQLDVDVRPRRPYPWARALLVVVLYISLLVVLWHFPAEGVRVFFRNLIKGFGYVAAALALVGVTVAAFLLIPPPYIRQGLDEEADGTDGDLSAGLTGCARSGRVLLVPALKDYAGVPLIWELLDDILLDMDARGSFVVDEHTGALTVMTADEQDLQPLVRVTRSRLRAQGFKVRLPH